MGAFAGLLPLRQRREDADDRIATGEDIRDRNADAGRRAVGHAGQVHHAAHSLRHEIVARALCVGTVLAEAGDRAIDEARAFRCEALVVETELRKAADLEIFDEYVRARRELANDASAVLAVEIHLDRALAAVRRVKIGRTDMFAVCAFDEWRTPTPGVVARTLAFDLDHIRPEVSQHLAGPGPRQNARKFEDAEAR